MNIREGIITDNWQSVRNILNSELLHHHSVVSSAINEEVRTIREALLYKDSMKAIASSLLVGAISGAPHEIDFDGINYKLLEESIRTCTTTDDSPSFSDESALIIIEFAKKLLDIRYFVKKNIWRRTTATTTAAARVIAAAASLPPPPVISSSPCPVVAVSVAVSKASVEDALDDILAYQTAHLDRLRGLLGMEDRQHHQQQPSSSSSTSTSSSSTSSSSPTTSSSTSIMRGGGGGVEWIHYIWDAVVQAQNEVRLVLQSMSYLKMLTSLKDAVNRTPDVILKYMESRHRTYNYYYDQAGRFGLLDIGEINLIDGTKHDEESDIYNIAPVQAASMLAKEYVNSIAFETSEELLKLLNTSLLLLEFRKTLGHNTVPDMSKVKVLMSRARHLIQQEAVAAHDGMKELNAFLTITAKTIEIQDNLRDVITWNGLCGPLDCLQRSSSVIASSSSSSLQSKSNQQLSKVLHGSVWIQQATSFLARMGTEVSMGLLHLFIEARILDKLRELVQSNSWFDVGCLVQKHRVQSSTWQYGQREFLHIEQSHRFHRISDDIHDFIASFHSVDELNHQNLLIFQSDFYSLRTLLLELKDLLNYKSTLLSLSSSSNDENISRGDGPDDVVDVGPVLSKDYSRSPVFLASKALYRLLKALLNKNWFDKQSMYDNAKQTVAGVIDPFLFRFFGLDSSNYFDNVDDGRQSFDDIQSIVSQTDHPLLSVEKKDPPHPDETVFHVLVSVDWTLFPIQISNFFDKTRNCLIDLYVQSDVKYYLTKGATTIDEEGNLTISSLYLELFQMSLVDAQRALELATSISIPFSYRKETVKWINASKIALRCRSYAIDNDLDSLADALREQGLLRSDGSPSLLRPDLCIHYDELSAYERYLQGVYAERKVKGAILYLISMSTSTHLEGVFQHPSIESVCAMVAAPTTVVNPTKHYVEMFRLASLIRDSIHAARMGIKNKLLSSFQVLMQSWHYRDEAERTLYQDEDYLLSASKVLIRICRASMYGDLFNTNNTNQSMMIGTNKSSSSSVAAAAAVVSIAKQPKNLNLYSIQSKLTGGSSNNSSGSSNSSDPLLRVVQRCTMQIVSGLCELLYFMEEKCYEFIMDKQKDKMKRPSSSYLPSRSSYKGNQVPYYCCVKLMTLQDSLSDEYISSEPCWTMSLVIINHYLKREVDMLRGQGHGQVPMSRGDMGEEEGSWGGSATTTAIALPVTTQLDVSYDLLSFLKDIRLEDMVLLEYLRTHPDLQQLQSLSSSSSSSSSSTESLTTMSLQKLANMNYLTTGGGDSSASSSSSYTSTSSSASKRMSAIASTPNMIAVVKHLALIKNNYYTEALNWKGTADDDSSSHNALIVDELVGRKTGGGLLADYATFLLQSIDRINSSRQS